MKLSTPDQNYSVADIKFMPATRYSQTPIEFSLYKNLWGAPLETKEHKYLPTIALLSTDYCLTIWGSHYHTSIVNTVQLLHIQPFRDPTNNMIGVLQTYMLTNILVF